MRIMNNSFYRTSGVAALYHSWNHLHLLKGQEHGSPFVTRRSDFNSFN